MGGFNIKANELKQQTDPGSRLTEKIPKTRQNQDTASRWKWFASKVQIGLLGR